ncbi:MAG: hypothetical protein KME18_16845 [Phormidium tanganyikae FI6-MK23]|nr:hypothetical protein [Phormidium tanganyikae FI6-MK23]
MPVKVAPRKSRYNSETYDKAPCPACDLKLTRREGYGKVFKSGEFAGRRKQRWERLNSECDRFEKNFLYGWAD